MIQANSGSANFSHTIFSPPIVSAHILQKLYQKTIFADISTTQYTGELQSKGDTIVFHRQPEFRVRNGGGINSTIRHDSGEFSSTTFKVGRTAYWSIAYDRLLADRTDGWQMLLSNLQESASRHMAEHMDATILGSYWVGAHARNRGANAGLISRSYNLGAPSAPLVINSANVLDFLTRPTGVLLEQNIDTETTPTYLIVPPVMKQKLMTSDLKAAFFSGMPQSTYLNGRVPNQICGLDLYVTNRCPKVFDTAVNKWCYILPFGSKDATAFVAMTEYLRNIEAEADTWLSYIQSRSCWDFFLLYPERVGYMYVTFE